MTVSECAEENVGIFVPYGRDLRPSTEKATGTKWSWRREIDGWPEIEKAVSGGENTVAVRS